MREVDGGPAQMWSVRCARARCGPAQARSACATRVRASGIDIILYIASGIDIIVYIASGIDILPALNTACVRPLVNACVQTYAQACVQTYA